jgi:SNF2 family DNA or RNA helicase
VATLTDERPIWALHGELTADGSSIVLIAAGAEHEIRQAARQLQLLTPRFRRSDPPGALIVPTTWATVVQLSFAFGPAWRPGPRLTAWITDQMTRRAAPGDRLTYRPPDGLEPRPYQVEGAAMIAAVGRAMIFDDPGTGKTITTVLGLVERATLGTPTWPCLVIAPASVVDPWVEAWRTWAPHVRAVAWRGPRRQRHTLAGTADVYVTSYDTARMDGHRDGPLMQMCPQSVVVDECHLIKTPRAERSLTARRLAKQARAFVALSGTPITHSPADLWPTLEALEPAAWPSRERWVDRYCLRGSGDYGEQIIGLWSGTEPEFRTSLLGQHRRVAKADVLAQLPPKVYSVRHVELPAEYRRAYDQMERDMIAQLPDGEELSVMSVLAQLTRLAQLASAAADVTVRHELDESGELREHVEVKLKAPSWKVDALMEVLGERPGEPVVAFAPSKQLVTLAGQQAAAAGLSVGYIVGGQSARERGETVEAFQAGKHDLLCVTTGAGGVGLTLTAARTVVFLQRPWSLVEATQAEDRCHRIGSERHDSIEVIDIVAKHTIDTRVRAVLTDKAGQLADLLQDRRIVTDLLGGKDS